MPLHISGKLISTFLIPGRRSKSVNAFAFLKRIIVLLREHRKVTIIFVHDDSNIHCPEITSYNKKVGRMNRFAASGIQAHIQKSIL